MERPRSFLRFLRSAVFRCRDGGFRFGSRRPEVQLLGDFFLFTRNLSTAHPIRGPAPIKQGHSGSSWDGNVTPCTPIQANYVHSAPDLGRKCNQMACAVDRYRNRFGRLCPRRTVFVPVQPTFWVRSRRFASAACIASVIASRASSAVAKRPMLSTSDATGISASNPSPT